MDKILTEWAEEIASSLQENETFCLALFSFDRKLLYANKPMDSLFKGDPSESLLNPSFEKLLCLNKGHTTIYNGFLTIGDYSSDNSSIKAHIYRKNNKLLVLGSVDSNQLVEQNESMIQLNREISNLQRQLIKEKHTLEKTLVKLNQANADLNEANASKDKFFSIIAHDLKNPFNVLMGFSDLLLENLRKYDLDQIEEQVGYINKTTHQTYNLLEDLLLWSKSQLDKINFEPQRLIFRDVCQEVIINLLPQCQKKNIKVYIYDKEDVIVYADSNMLKTIIRNLLSNAIKFSFANSSIVVKIEKNQEKAIITVSDKGVGISIANQARLWKISEQYSTEGTEKEGGTGLGLLLCKDFVDKHDGKIWVESELGKGSDFMFSIPFLNE